MIQGLYKLLVSASILLLAAYRSPGPPPAPDRKRPLAEQGGLRLTLQVEPFEGDDEVTEEMLGRTRAVVEKRAMELGVATPAVTVVGARQIMAELPLATALDEISIALTERGYLELADGGSDPPTPGTFITTEPGASTDSAPGETWPAVINMEDIDGATALLAQFAGMPLVRFSLTDKGKGKLADFTTRNLGSHILVVLDKRVISTPRIYDPMTGGMAEIVGMTFWEAARIVAQLKSGLLPVRLQVVEVQQI